MKKIARMKPDLQMISAPKMNKEVLIVDNEEELQKIESAQDFEEYERNGGKKKSGLLGKRNFKRGGNSFKEFSVNLD